MADWYKNSPRAREDAAITAGLEAGNKLAGQYTEQDIEEAQVKQATDKLKEFLANPEVNKRSVQFAKGGISQLGPEHNDDRDLMSAIRLREMLNQREEDAVRKLEKRSSDVGTAQIVPSLQRAEEAAPGLFTNEKEVPKLKSVGGFKNLIPNFGVAPLEKMGILPEGAASERSALQELQNAKIYDSSGKQINEAEMKRIKDAMAISGLNSSEDIVKALRQSGYTLLEKQKGVTAGAPRRIVEKFKSEGGLVDAKSVSDLLNRTAKSNAAGQPIQQQQAPVDLKSRLEMLRAKARGN